MVDVGRLVDGDGLEAGRVEGGGARPVAFGGAPEAVWLKLARRRSLATEVHGPEGEVGVELVPSRPMERRRGSASPTDACPEGSEVQH